MRCWAFQGAARQRKDGHMSISILEELYFGKLDPNTVSFDRSSCYGKATQTIVDHENKLMELLEGKEKELFTDFSNAHCELNGITAVNKFTLGFRLGALVMVDVFTSTENGLIG